MPDFYKGKIPIIKRSLNEGFVRGTPDGFATGCVPRDYDVDPVGVRDSPDQMVLVPEDDDDARFDEDEANKTSLEHIYLPGGVDGPPAFQFLDQNGFPDCWAHSTAHAAMIDRVAKGLPPLRYNAVAVATLLRQTNGGWCGLSMKFGREHGFPVVGTGPGEWPYQSRNGRDTPELRASMATHKVYEDWYDLGRREYNQQLTKRQIATCSANNWPVPSDYPEFGHSMLTLRRVRLERGVWGLLTLNSWQGFGHHGLCVLLERYPANSCALRTTIPSVG